MQLNVWNNILRNSDTFHKSYETIDHSILFKMKRSLTEIFRIHRLPIHLRKSIRTSENIPKVRSCFLLIGYCIGFLKKWSDRLLGDSTFLSGANIDRFDWKMNFLWAQEKLRQPIKYVIKHYLLGLNWLYFLFQILI